MLVGFFHFFPMIYLVSYNVAIYLLFHLPSLRQNSVSHSQTYWTAKSRRRDEKGDEAIHSRYVGSGSCHNSRSITTLCVVLRSRNGGQETVWIAAETIKRSPEAEEAKQVCLFEIST